MSLYVRISLTLSSFTLVLPSFVLPTPPDLCYRVCLSVRQNSLKQKLSSRHLSFDVSFRPRFPVIGTDGIDLRDLWATNPQAYLSMFTSGFPNYAS